MARIQPPAETELLPSVKRAFEKHVSEYKGRITNMKATLGHSLLAFEIYMHWYSLYQEIKIILGERLAYLYAYSISHASNCPLCSTYFRKIIIDAGESPENLQLTSHEEKILDFGSAIAKYHGNVDDNLYNKVAELFNTKEMVLLVAFAGQMIATNIFNNVIETDIDEYLTDYLTLSKSTTEK